MGNRAVITWGHDYNYQLNVGIYLHWNGGRDSVEAFLKYCELKGYRDPSKDNYGIARCVQVISNFVGGGDSIGVDICARLDCDNFDNGVYLVEGWKINGRLFHSGSEQNGYDLRNMLKAIDSKQPEGERLKDHGIDLDTVDLTERTEGEENA